MKLIKKIFGQILTILTIIILLIFAHAVVPRSIPDELKSEALKKFKLNISNIKKRDYIIIIDYSKDIFQKRLWLYDIINDEIILNSRVTHALNSGLIFCNDISNTPKTKKTCIGSFVTGNQYSGKFGNSMNIHGLDNNNSNANKRRIVFHPNCKHKYYGVTVPSFLALYSSGCFAFHEDDMDPFIDKVKNGVFMYVNN